MMSYANKGTGYAYGSHEQCWDGRVIEQLLEHNRQHLLCVDSFLSEAQVCCYGNEGTDTPHVATIGL